MSAAAGLTEPYMPVRGAMTRGWNTHRLMNATHQTKALKPRLSKVTSIHDAQINEVFNSATRCAGWAAECLYVGASKKCLLLAYLRR